MPATRDLVRSASPGRAEILSRIRPGRCGRFRDGRLYRLDDQYDLGDGWFLVEFHNDDTDTWETGDYSSEIRVDIAPIWDGTPNEGRCVNALAPGAAKMIEGVPVRTLFKGTVKIMGVDGRI